MAEQEADQEIGVEAPPFSARLKYHLLTLPPDERYRPWVEEDMLSASWGMRRVIPMAMGYAVGALIAAFSYP